MARIEWEQLRPLLAWTAALAVAVLAFQLLGRTPMASPAVTQPRQWLVWAGTQTADTIAFNVLRLLGLALSWYLLGITAVGAAARLVAWGGLVRVADVLTVGPVRTLLQQTLGVVLAASAVASVPGAAVTTGGTATPVVASAEADAGRATAETDPILEAVVPGALDVDVLEGEAGAPDRMVTEASLRPSGAVAHDSWVERLGAGAAGAIGAPPAARPAASTAEVTTQLATHVVQPGDHFWALAEESVGPGANDHEVMTYWQALVEANRSRLVDPANPDLLLPGQVLVLPRTAGEAGP